MNNRDNIDAKSRNEEIEEAAGRWLERASLGTMTEEGIRELEVWKAQSLAHRVAYIRLDATWQRTERLAALRRPMFERPVNGSTFTIWRSARYAAAFGVLLLLGQAPFLVRDKQMISPTRLTSAIAKSSV